MPEVVTFVDSFDHTGPAWAPAKYRVVVGAYTEVAGPYHGVGARFAAAGNEARDPAGFAWDSGAWSGSVRVDGAGWTGSGEAALLAPGQFTTAGGGADFAHHWLTVDQAGRLRVRGWAELPSGPPATVVLAQSATGAVPLDAWCRLEYRCQLRTDSTRTGTVGCRVNGTEVLAGSGLVTTDPQRAVADANTWRLGHLRVDAGGTDGVGGLGSGGAAVGVAYDDVCHRAQSTLGAALLGYRDDPARPHRVVCLRPTGPGALAELAVVGAAANWAACAEAPPDGDTSYVEKAASLAARDRYAVTPAPAITEGAAGAALQLAGLGVGTSVSTPRFVVGLTDGAGTESTVTTNSDPMAPAYRYGMLRHGGVEALTDALLAGLQIGWGHTSGTFGSAYRGTQVVAELWYRPGAAPEPEPTGGQRWSVGWVG